MAYHRIDSKFWTDLKSSAWSDDGKLLALYLKSSPHATMEGFYYLPTEYICADLRWSPQRLQEPFATLLRDGFISYDGLSKVVLIRNALKYQAPENPGQADAAVKRVAELPETPLLREFQLCATQYCRRLAERLAERFGGLCGEPPTPTPTLPLTLPPPLTHPPVPTGSVDVVPCGNVDNPEGAQMREGEPEPAGDATQQFLDDARRRRLAAQVGEEVPPEMVAEVQDETAHERKRG